MMKLSLLTESKADEQVADKIRKAIREVNYYDEDSGKELSGQHGVQRAGVQVWWHPTKKKAFVSVGDWADPKPWLDAVAPAIGGRNNVDYASEAGPSGDGWVMIKDYQRIGDRAGMDDERRKVVDEGVVAAARGDIVNIVNDLASRIANVAEAVFFNDRRMASVLGIRKPEVEFSESEEDPAIVTLAVGRRSPQSIAIIIYGDGGGEIRLELTEQLSKLLKIARRAIMSSEDEVNHKLGAIVAAIRTQLKAR